MLAVCASGAAQVPPRVERVIDGETILVAGIGEVRLLGLDVPRTIDAQRPADPDADPAVAFLNRLVAGRTVRLESDETRTDSAKRPLAYVFLEDGTLVNAEILKQGLGRTNAEIGFRRVNEFRAHEREAQSARRGMWSNLPPPAVATEPGAPAPAPRAPGAVIIR